MSTRRRIPVTPDMVSLWVPSGTGRAIDIIRDNDGQCEGTHPNVPVISGRNIVANGAFTTDDDPPDSWTASNATLSTESGGLVGNCMKVLDGGAGNGYGYQLNGTVVGKVYNFSCWAKDIDTGQNGLIEVGTSAGNASYYSSGAITDDTGVTYTATFTATTTTTFISLNCTSSGGTYYFDSVSLKEQQQLINTAVGWEFDGTNDYISLPVTSIPAGNEISISFWAYTDMKKSNNLVWFEDANGRVVNISIVHADETTYWDCGVDAGGYDRISKASLDPLGKWHYWVFTKNVVTEYMKIYLDSELWHSDSGKTKPITVPNIAGKLGGDAAYFIGYIAFFFIANKAWSVAQVSNFYNATKGLFAPRG